MPIRPTHRGEHGYGVFHKPDPEKAAIMRFFNANSYEVAAAGCFEDEVTGEYTDIPRGRHDARRRRVGKQGCIPFREVRHGAVPRVPCLRARARAWRIAIGETIRPRRNYDISAKEASQAPFSMERNTRSIEKPPSGGFSAVATIRFYAAGRSALLLIFLMTAIKSSCCCELNMRIKDCGRSNGGCVKAAGSI